MPKRATVKLRGQGEKLYLKGSCPGVALQAGSLKMQVDIDGEMRVQGIRIPEGPFAFEFKLPLRIAGRTVVEVSVEPDHAFRWQKHLLTVLESDII